MNSQEIFRALQAGEISREDAKKELCTRQKNENKKVGMVHLFWYQGVFSVTRLKSGASLMPVHGRYQRAQLFCRVFSK